MNRGDVYLARHDPVEGSEQGGVRPVVIVSRNSLNASREHVIAVPFTRTVLPRPLPTHVAVPADEAAGFGESVARAEHVRAIAKSRLVERRGRSPPRMAGSRRPSASPSPSPDHRHSSLASLPAAIPTNTPSNVSMTCVRVVATSAFPSSAPSTTRPASDNNKAAASTLTMIDTSRPTGTSSLIRHGPFRSGGRSPPASQVRSAPAREGQWPPATTSSLRAGTQATATCPRAE
ncbi:MAG: type II toxin-antitoxin system PemK/MazF family toxin [Dehalococcoidia bacterium]|nr:type II toxin-antitoxin system PemK/MazF family toxin [Dehalococcoidia bacterium]